MRNSQANKSHHASGTEIGDTITLGGRFPNLSILGKYSLSCFTGYVFIIAIPTDKFLAQRDSDNATEVTGMLIPSNSMTAPNLDDIIEYTVSDYPNCGVLSLNEKLDKIYKQLLGQYIAVTLVNRKASTHH
jgi:hypothetical protein